MEDNHQTNDSLRLLDHGLCPNCGSDQIAVRRTKKPHRRMECKACNAMWETVTINLWIPEAVERVAEAARRKRELEEQFPLL